jgi:hypothetical protein
MDDLLVQFPMSKEDQKLLRKEMVNRPKGSYSAPKLQWMPEAKARMQFGSVVYILDFQDIRQNTVALNGNNISLQVEKTFVNYRSMIEAIRKSGAPSRNASTASWFLPLAWAEDPDTLSTAEKVINWAGDHTIGAIFAMYNQTVHPKDLKDVPTADLEKIIIASYQQDAKEDGPAQLSTFTFTCDPQTHNLIQVSDSNLVDGEKVVTDHEHDDTMIYTPGKGYIERVRTCSVVDVEVDTDNTVNTYTETKNDQTNCPKIGEKAFAHGPFFAFPVVANDCCHKSGCEPAVKAALQKLIQYKSKQVPFSPFNGTGTSI